MSLTMTELMAADGEVILSDSNKRKLVDTNNILVKRCKTESPTTTAAFTDDEQSTSEHLSDIADDEQSDASEQNEKPSTSSTTTDRPIEMHKKRDAAETILNPQYGQLVNRREFRRAGPYIIGQEIGHSPVDSIVQYLAKKENTNTFVQLKILMLNNDTTNDSVMQEERQGKMLMHTEFSLLSLLKDEPGVIQQHGMFSDMALEEVPADSNSNNNFYTGDMRKRLILVLDCVAPHDFDPHSSAYINLQQHLINRRKLTEIEALKIFNEIITVVESLHKRNIIHRDLKLGNIVLNKHSNKITIINFCLGKYLLSENDLLYDQRGSPAYISPDVLCGKPYKGKPSDMWALGVVLFMMLYRQFPFFESTPTALFRKIKAAEYIIPMNCEISKDAEDIIRGLLQLNPEKRLTASQVRERIKIIIDESLSKHDNDHMVPQMDMNDDLVPVQKSISKKISALANDQVVPSMATPKATTTTTAIPAARKRRRSTEKLFTEMLQRGISVEQIDPESDEWKQSNVFKLRKFFEENRLRFEMPRSETQSQSQPQSQSPTSPDNQSQTISSLIRSLPSTLRIVPRQGEPDPTFRRTLMRPSGWQSSVLSTRGRIRNQPNLPSLIRSLPNSLQIIRQVNQNNNSGDNNRNGNAMNMPQSLASSNGNNNSTNRLQTINLPQLYRYMLSSRRQQAQNGQGAQMRNDMRNVRRGHSNDTSNGNNQAPR